MFQLFGILILALVLTGGYASCEHRRANGLEVAIAANKAEAARQLAEEQQLSKAAAINSQRDYDGAIKTLQDNAGKYPAGRLRDPGRGNSCPTAPGPSSGVAPAAPTGSELSEQTGSYLRAEADRADQAATYALKCREFVYEGQSIRQRLRANLKGN